MEERTWKYLDRSGWSRGEWDTEPDKIQFEDKKTGYPCLVVRNLLGGLCGYVGVTKGHPFYKKDYQDIEDVSVHGGLTFSDECNPEGKICHEDDENKEPVWWLGFDCVHGGDAYPGEMTVDQNMMVNMLSMLTDSGAARIGKYGTYRNVLYVKKEIAKLAKQIKKHEESK